MFQELINTLRQNGGKMTNKALLAALAWEAPAYKEVVTEMVHLGMLKKARGRGGSVIDITR